MENKKIAVSQSNYIPWKGYFDNINQVDEFILYDDMQYTKRDWRNRNKIKTPNGIVWLTVPVKVKGKYFQKINETRISDSTWNVKHLNILKQNYPKAKCYKQVLPIIEEWYVTASQDTISEVNHHFLTKICEFLGVDTKITFSSDYTLLEEGKTERLVSLCKQIAATEYYSGSAAKRYMDESLFMKQGIDVHYYNYSGYQEYEQLHGEFDHGVSILDLIFNEGENTMAYLKR